MSMSVRSLVFVDEYARACLCACVLCVHSCAYTRTYEHMPTRTHARNHPHAENRSVSPVTGSLARPARRSTPRRCFPIFSNLAVSGHCNLVHWHTC